MIVLGKRDDFIYADGPGHPNDQDTDAATADNGESISMCCSASSDRTIRHGDWLNHCGLFVCERIRNSDEGRFVRNDVLGEAGMPPTACGTSQPTMVVHTREAEVATTAVGETFDANSISDADGVDSFTQCRDDTGHLVSSGRFGLFPTSGVNV